MTSAQLDRMMRLTFGADWRSKRIVGPLGSFALRDAFGECGLPDPYEPPASSGLPGVWQFNTTPPAGIPARTVAEQLAASAAYLCKRYGR